MTNSTQEPREVSPSRKGEGHEFLLIGIIGVVLLSIVAVIVFILLASTTNTSKSVLEQDKGFVFDSSLVVRGLFNITALEYVDAEVVSCGLAENYQKPVMLTLRFQSYEVPDSCTVFLNNKVVLNERRLDPDCVGACPFQEFSRQLSLGDMDYRDNHIIKVCCNQICIEKPLEGLCNEAAVEK